MPTSKSRLIPERIFRQEFTGNVPINLVASSLALEGWGAFVPDPGSDLGDTRALDYAAYPPTALMTHDDAGDFRHALGGIAAWALPINQVLCARYLFARQDRIAALPAGIWRRLLGRVRSAAGDLSAVMAGNHLFFVGEDGARTTLAAVEKLRRSANEIRNEMTQRLID